MMASAKRIDFGEVFLIGASIRGREYGRVVDDLDVEQRLALLADRTLSRCETFKENANSSSRSVGTKGCVL
jgi:hypothetical protein